MKKSNVLWVSLKELLIETYSYNYFCLLDSSLFCFMNVEKDLFLYAFANRNLWISLISPETELIDVY